MSPHARAALRDLQHRAQPRLGFNPGVVNVLLRDGLARSVLLASPYPSHKGRDIEHLAITKEGVDALAAAGA